MSPSRIVRPLIYDATHLTLRLTAQAPTGIDRVDFAYAKAMGDQPTFACAAHYGWNRPHFLTLEKFSDLVRCAKERSNENRLAEEDDQWPGLRAWLTDLESRPIIVKPRASILRAPEKQFPVFGKSAWKESVGLSIRRILPAYGYNAKRLFHRMRFHFADDYQTSIPHGAVYLNVAQAGLEHPRFFRWLAQRPDIFPVFLVHDLLPLDRPEYFRPEYQAVFERRVQTIMKYARGLIVTSRIVEERLRREYAHHNLQSPPLLVAPLPSPLGALRPAHDPHLEAAPYFVMVGTLEPRKNHALILRLWKEFAKERIPPKLVLVGAHGPASKAVAWEIASHPALSASVRHVSDLSPAALRALLFYARGLIAPSLDEGYGLPLVEALALGAPVIASDIPVFHEVTQGRAWFAALDDLESWRAGIKGFLARSPMGNATVKAFRAPTWTDYFQDLQAFLGSFPDHDIAEAAPDLGP